MQSVVIYKTIKRYDKTDNVIRSLYVVVGNMMYCMKLSGEDFFIKIKLNQRRFSEVPGLNSFDFF